MSKSNDSMLLQLPMVLPPATHRWDARTSLEAELAITTSGKRQRHADLVLAEVRAFPGLTAHDYGERTGLGRVEAARRLSDLKFAGRVQRVGTAVRAGTRQSCWYLTASESKEVSHAGALATDEKGERALRAN
jgi:hypothetical protein